MTVFAASADAIGAFAKSFDFEDSAIRLYVRAVALLSGPPAAAAVAEGHARPLAGGPLAFTMCDVTWRGAGRSLSVTAPVAALAEWAEASGGRAGALALARLENMTAARSPFAGLPLAPVLGEAALIMGVINVTPDSFSDGGEALEAEAAVARGLALREAGADILDIGGESTRPGAAPVAEEEELRRVLPVIRELAARGARVSVDTRHARVMAAALEAGAAIVNDVTALSGDADSLKVAARGAAAVALMHMRGEPATMQDDPAYEDAPLDIFDYLEARIEACEAAGIGRERILIDPGIGFGKTAAHNGQILRRLALFHGLGCGILIGVSRKRFLGAFSRGAAPRARLPGSLAAALAARDQGVQVLRVHDVVETHQALAVWETLRGG